MNSFWTFINYSVLFTAIIAWFIAQVLKVILVFVKDRRMDFSRLIGSGGMPSSHSAFVVSLSLGIGLIDGFLSSTFAITVVLALVVMYDAAGVRRAAGQQARILNKIVMEWGRADYSDTEKKLKELLGHTPIEVFAGAVLGAAIAVFRHM